MKHLLLFFLVLIYSGARFITRRALPPVLICGGLYFVFTGNSPTGAFTALTGALLLFYFSGKLPRRK